MTAGSANEVIQDALTANNLEYEDDLLRRAGPGLRGGKSAGLKRLPVHGLLEGVGQLQQDRLLEVPGY